VKLDDLLHDNNIDADGVTKVRVGTKLTIRNGTDSASAPAPASAPAASVVLTTHVVKKDETLWSISQACDLTVSELLALNPGVSAAKLYVGARLKVPATAAGVPAATPADPRPTGTDVAPATVKAATPPPDGELWPHAGPRTAVTDGHFKHIRIAGKVGDPVVAVASGRVTWVSPYRGYRNVVMIETRSAQARDAYQFLYAGVDDVYVRAGDWVEKGATIARMGADGVEGKGQVLFAVYQGAQLVDHTRLSWL
jgi:LysM repeat protein